MLIKHFLTFVFFAYGSLLYAAGFDCTKANTKVEVLICSNKGLSELDDQLGRLYSAIKNENPNLLTEQKKWLTNVRGRCESEDCLFHAYEDRVKELGKRKGCVGAENEIIGRWIDAKGGFFEEMAFSVNDGARGFGSWRHHRPELFGEWSINGCVLNISGANGSIKFEFRVKRIEKSRLYLVNEEESEEVYRK